MTPSSVIANIKNAFQKQVILKKKIKKKKKEKKKETTKNKTKQSKKSSEIWYFMTEKMCQKYVKVSYLIKLSPCFFRKIIFKNSFIIWTFLSLYC